MITIKKEKIDSPTVRRTSRKRKIETTKIKDESDVNCKEELVDEDHVKKIVRALNTLVRSKNKDNILFEDEEAVFLSIQCVKIPLVPPHFERPILPNSFLGNDQEVCLIVSDTKRKNREDYEVTSRFYENLLALEKAPKIKSIIPLQQLKKEYDTYEAKRKLCELYDLFLVQGKISGKVHHILGKIFINKRKVPIPVKLERRKLRSQLENALRRSFLHIHTKGDSYTLQVGNISMSEDRILKNVMVAIDHLKKVFPGGWKNIAGLYLKTFKSIAIPIYVSLRCKNKVEIPVASPKRPKLFKEVTDEISTLLHSKVTVSPMGDVKVITLNQSKVASVKKTYRNKRLTKTKVLKKKQAISKVLKKEPIKKKETADIVSKPKQATGKISRRKQTDVLQKKIQETNVSLEKKQTANKVLKKKQAISKMLGKKPITRKQTTDKVPKPKQAIGRILKKKQT